MVRGVEEVDVIDHVEVVLDDVELVVSGVLEVELVLAELVVAELVVIMEVVLTEAVEVAAEDVVCFLCVLACVLV